MKEEAVAQHRRNYTMQIARILHSGGHPSMELNEGACQALCALAGMMFATTRGIPYDSLERGPEDLMNAAYEGLVRWKEQFDMRQ